MHNTLLKMAFADVNNLGKKQKCECSFESKDIMISYNTIYKCTGKIKQTMFLSPESHVQSFKQASMLGLTSLGTFSHSNTHTCAQLICISLHPTNTRSLSTHTLLQAKPDCTQIRNPHTQHSHFSPPTITQSVSQFQRQCRPPSRSCRHRPSG